MFLSVSILIWTHMVFTAAEPLCDPETQYLLNDECCLKCKPGTSMVPTGECRDPVCKACDEEEYMDKYTTEAKCERQPYCDPNKNFKKNQDTSKTARATCLCMEGFHCSSKSCITCNPHRVCEKGYGATTKGDQTHDTVCEKCPDGTFSDEVSWDGPCKKMTTCDVGDDPQNGSSVSDNTCVKNQHLHIGLGISIVVLLLVLAAAVFLLFRRFRNKRGFLKPIPENGQSSVPQPEVTPDSTSVLLPTSAEDTPSSVRPTTPLCSQICVHSMPEENEDVVRTVNGDVLSQDGKEHIISQPETQEQDFILLSNNNELVTL